MKAFVLAGGLGTRLRPLTLTRPKHLLPIANRPHIEHVFDLVLAAHIDHVVMLTGHLSDAFEPIFKQAEARGLRVDVALEEEPLGTAGAFKNAEAFVGGERFLAFNGDVLTDVDLSAVVRRHLEDEAEASLVLTPVDDPSAFGVVPTDPDGRVLGFVEKPRREDAPTNLINAGIYVFEPSVLERVPTGAAWSAERQLFPELVEDGARLFAHGTDAYWMDIGTPENYLQANVDALTGRYVTDSVGPAPDGVLVDPTARLDATAETTRSVVGAGARIGARAAVVESVLLPGAIVEEEGRLERSVLGEGATVTKGATVVSRALGDGEIV